MGSKWHQAKLGTYIDSCLGKMLDQNKNKGDYCKYLGNSNVRWGYFELDELSEMRFESHEHERYGIRKGDLIICEGGEPGRCAIWEDENPNMKIQKALHRVRTLEGLDSEYLYYWFLFSGRTGRLDAYFTGTTIKHLTGKALSELPIDIPPLSYQKYCAKILRSLDKKITLNRQINQTLEQMAQTLFKSWFVDFDPVIDNALDAGNDIPDTLQERAEQRRLLRAKADFKPLPAETRALFPSEFEETELGWVPKGWAAPYISDFVEVTDYVANGSFAALKENVELKDIPDFAIYVRTTDFKNDFSEENLKYVDENAFKFLKKSELKGDEVIISNVGDVGTVFRPPVWLDMPMTLGSNAISCNSKLQNHYLYNFFSNHAGQHLIDGITSGSAQQKFNKTGFRSLQIPLPSEQELIEFNKIYDELNLKAINTKKEILILNKLKNIILPKLISGELALDDLPEEIAEAAETV